MRIVMLSEFITLEQKLKDIVKHKRDLKVEQSSHRTFRRKKRYWFFFWRQVAWIDIYYRAIRIHVREWQQYEAIVMELARTMEKYTSVREMVIEVY